MDPNDLIAQIAAQKLGPAPAAAGRPPGQPPGPAQGQAQGQPPAPPKADPAPTEMEKAQAKLQPKQADDAAAEESVKMLRVGDQDFTESQITGTMQRYKDLNFKWQSEVAPNKAVLEVAKQLAEAARKSGHDPKGEEIAGLIAAAVQAYVKNPQMGNGAKGQGGQPTQGAQGGQGNGKAAMSGDDDMESSFSEWEKENAVKLPPGFRDSLKSTKEMGSKLDQVMGMLQQVMQGGAAGQRAQQQASQQLQQAQGMQADAATRMIATNLEGSFRQAGLTADDPTRADFRMFAAQRGYDLGDFLDPELAATVVQDYKANKDAPEITRLREIAKKRAAFTGNVEGAPGADGAAGAAAPGDPMLAQLTSAAMGRRGL